MLCANYIVDTNEDKPAALRKLLAAVDDDKNYHKLVRAIQTKMRYKDLTKDHHGQNFKEK